VRACYFDGLAGIGVRETDTHRGTADARADDFAQRLIFEFKLSRPHLRGIGKLGRGARGPSYNPMISIRPEKRGSESAGQE
jgi:hypothetical protein